jgi:hypothetical protein
MTDVTGRCPLGAPLGAPLDARASIGKRLVSRDVREGFQSRRGHRRRRFGMLPPMRAGVVLIIAPGQVSNLRPWG